MTDLSVGQLLALSGAGLVAAALNTLAGGGSLISFPVMVMIGIPPIAANATNAFALTLGGVSGALSSTDSLPRIRQHLIRFALPTLAGATAGAWLLLTTTQASFNLIVPVLLMVATTLLALPSILVAKPVQVMRGVAQVFAPICVIIVAIYGGYFGAGMGIVFVAVLDWLIPGNLHDNNAIKNWLQCMVNIVATTIFFAKGVVLIVPGLALMSGGIIGGYASGLLSRRLDPKRLRLGMIAYGVIITCVFAVRLLC